MIMFTINFKNGMAIFPNAGWMGTIVSAERDVTIVKHANEWPAFNYCVEKYERQNYVPGGPLLDVPSLAQMQQCPWYINRFHKPAVLENAVRHFVIISATPGRVGYFTDIDLLQTVMINEPVGTVALEMLDKVAVIRYLQSLIAKDILRFSGYFDTREFEMLQDVYVNTIMNLHYYAWMKEHCILPPGLQPFSPFGYAEPALSPAGTTPKKLSPSGTLMNNAGKGGESDG